MEDNATNALTELTNQQVKAEAWEIARLASIKRDNYSDFTSIRLSEYHAFTGNVTFLCEKCCPFHCEPITTRMFTSLHLLSNDCKRTCAHHCEVETCVIKDNLYQIVSIFGKRYIQRFVRNPYRVRYTIVKEARKEIEFGKVPAKGTDFVCGACCFQHCGFSKNPNGYVCSISCPVHCILPGL